MQDLFLNRRITQFLAIYEAGTLHGAADRLHITQPALSVGLRNLEETLGTSLFDRSVKGMSPTPSGEVLYRFATTLQQGGRFVTEEIAALSGHTAGRLRIGAGVGWSTTIMPGVLRDLHRLFPTLPIDLVTGVGEQLAARLIAGELDIVIAAGAIADLAAPEIHGEYLGNLAMKAVVDPGAPLAQTSQVTPQQLSALEWVGFYEDDNIIQLANQYLSLRGLPPASFAMRTNSPTALISFVKGSQFATILIAPLTETAVRMGLVELDLSEPLWALPVHVYNRDIAEGSGSVTACRSLFRDAMKAFR